MKKLFGLSITVFLILAVIISCNKQTEILQTATLQDYFPLQTGRTFTYRMDSTVPAPFGTALIVRSYHAKDTIESTFTDNQGRLSYRIWRFTRDTAGIQPWQFSSTFVATATGKWLEYVDNNLRYLKLHLPIRNGYLWKAHSFIDTKSLNTPVSFLDEWEYEYRNTNMPYTVLNKTFDTTVTVFQQDETTPPGPFNPNNFQQRNFGTEVYAKGVGLIYKEFLHWTWQTTPPPAKFEDGSYGVKLRLISYK